MVDWKKYPDEKPPVEDDGSLDRSIEVLVFDGRRVRVGYLQGGYDPDYDDFPPRWKLEGPDMYDLDGVTHWAPLPAPPTTARRAS